MRLPLCAAVATLAILAAGCAHDREQTAAMGPLVLMPSPPPVEITRYADENKDGKVTRDEARADAQLARAFDAYDVDDNDILDRGEFARLEAETRERQAAALMPPEGEPAVTTSDAARPAQGETLNRTGFERIRRD